MRKPGWFPPQSIRLNLGLIVLAAIAPIVAVLLFSGLERRNHEIESAKEDALRLANSFASQQERMVSGVRQLQNTLTLLPAVQNRDLEACSRIFEKLLQTNPMFGNITLVNPDGKVAASGLPLTKANFGDQKQVREAIENREFSAGEYIIGRISEVPIIAFASPIIDSKGLLTGVITTSLRLDQFARQFENASLPDGSIFSMLDHKGVRLCYHPPNEKAPIGKPILPSSWAGYSTATQEGLSRHTGMDGVIRYYAFRQLRIKPDDPPYMVVVVAIPESVAHDKADALTRKYLIWLAGAFLLSLLAAWTLGKQGIIRRLNALGALAARLGNGELEARTGLSETTGSLGLVAKAFDDMASALEAREAERLEAIKALRDSEDRLVKAQRVANVGSWEYDISTGKVWGSEEAFRIYGIDRKTEYLPLDEVERHIIDADKVNQALAELITENINYDIEYKIKNQNSGELTAVQSIAELVCDASGHPVKVIGVLHDITDSKNKEEERIKLQTQLQQAQKMESVGTLAGGIAHDFNNLLQAINGYTQLLLMEKSKKDPDRPKLKEIEKAGSRAAQLVRQLLLFSRKAEADRRPIDLNEEVEQARRLLERTIPRMIDITLHLGADLWTVLADPVQMEQALLNLGSNAADAMPDGGGLVIETQNITLDEEYTSSHMGAQPGRYVLLSFSDTGHGMDKETMGKIFDPFFTTKEFGKGTGLGLASVYGIVKGHGGYIMCYSESGQGTTFKIYLPAMEQDEKGESEEEQEDRLTGGTETILLVDDEAPIRDFASHVLQHFGYRTMTASDGREAVKIYTDKKDEIDLIILDIGMPVMGGHQCLVELRKVNPSARVLMASGYSINGHARKAIESGAMGFISKPYQLNELITRVRAALDEKK
ncbi:MAG: response regulator [Proteobacteria bacterium]|nr:response regulator [Pseudomonadota bacterium]